MSKQLIAIDASPNTQTEDVLLALKLLLSPWTWKQNVLLKELEQYFIAHYDAKTAWSTNSGRTSLQLLLSSLINPGDEVLIQAFTCLAVPDAVNKAGGKPVFVDIEEKTYNIDPKDLRKKITKHSKVVIVQHTFGIPAALDEIKKICDERELILIEDCAHALGARYKNKLVGTFGDAAIFSFNQDKVVSGVSGGVFITKKLNKTYYSLTAQSNGEMARTILHPLLWSIITPLYEQFNIGKAIAFLAWKLGLFHKDAGTVPSRVQALSHPQATLILQGLMRLERDNERRVQIADTYRRELSNLPIIHPEIAAHTTPIYLRYPIQVDDPKKLFQNARKKGIILGKWYDAPVFPWSTPHEWTLGGCQTAEAVGKKIVNLPTFPRLTDEDVTRIIDVVKQTYGT